MIFKLRIYQSLSLKYPEAVEKSDWCPAHIFACEFVDTSLIFCLEKPKGESLSKVILYSPKAAPFQVSSLFQNDDQAKLY